MENAADALKISFAVFIFVFAIVVAFSVIAKAKETSDVVLFYSDRTNFYEMEDTSSKNRTVDLSEVIATLYRSVGESVNVTIIDKNGNDITNITVTDDLGNITKVALYNFGGDSGTSEEKINKFIEEKLQARVLYNGQRFMEEFVEVPYTGIYKTGEDGSQIAISTGRSRTYITYYEIDEN